MQRAVGWLRRCSTMVDTLGVFSSNEELDDIATADLPFLLLPKLLADLLARTPLREPAERATVLEEAAAQYSRYYRLLPCNTHRFHSLQVTKIAHRDIAKAAGAPAGPHALREPTLRAAVCEEAAAQYIGWC